MRIVFPHERMAQDFSSRKTLTQQYGPENAKRIMRRLDDLRAADNLGVMRSLPGRCHALTGDLAGLLAIDVRHPYRLIFAPANDPVPRKTDGGLDWAAVTIIKIMAVENYHD